MQQRKEAARQRLIDKQNATTCNGTKETVLSHSVETNEQSEDTAPTQPHFVAFARVFSGTLRKGQTLFVLGPKHDPSHLLHVSTRQLKTSMSEYWWHSAVLQHIWCRQC